MKFLFTTLAFVATVGFVLPALAAPKPPIALQPKPWTPRPREISEVEARAPEAMPPIALKPVEWRPREVTDELEARGPKPPIALQPKPWNPRP